MASATVLDILTGVDRYDSRSIHRRCVEVLALSLARRWCHDPGMTKRSLAVIACALLAGCSLDSEGIGATEPFDSGGVDTTVVVESDTGAIFVPEDTLAADASEPETTAIDSTMVDSEAPDTAPLDSGAADTAEAPPTTSLSITSRGLGTAGTSVNLTTEGTRDWAHWGHMMTGSFNNKNGSSWIARGTETGASTFESGVINFTWTDGAPPNVAVTAPPRGLTMSTPGENVTFTVQGDPTRELTLLLWASGTGDATITGTLTGSTDSSNSTFVAGVHEVTFKFRTATTASKLRVEVKKGVLVGTFNVFAAALK
jgi:hypothetical protein